MQLTIDAHYYNKLDIEGFSRMMKDPSYCYKFYWLEAIVQLISKNKKEATYDEIINEISKLLDDLDAEIREKVEEVINQMYEDGDLTPILKSVMEENPDIIQDILKDNPDLLPDAIKDAVEEMIADGSLNGVFQDVFAVINDGKHSTLELSRKYRALFQAHSYNATTKEEELYSNILK